MLFGSRSGFPPVPAPAVVPAPGTPEPVTPPDPAPAVEAPGVPEPVDVLRSSIGAVGCDGCVVQPAMKSAVTATMAKLRMRPPVALNAPVVRAQEKTSRPRQRPPCGFPHIGRRRGQALPDAPVRRHR